MMKLDKTTWLLRIAFILLGILAGYLYWRFVGCESGTCAITSKPVNSMLYGSILGFLLGDLINDFRKKHFINKSNEQV